MFVEHLQPQVVNDKIFPNVVSGFMDTNPVVRESTIKVRLALTALGASYRKLLPPESIFTILLSIGCRCIFEKPEVYLHHLC